FGLSREGHVLRLHVSREAGIFFGDYVTSLEGATPKYTDRVSVVNDFDSHLCQLGDQSREMTGIATRYVQVPSGERTRNDESAGFDPIRNDAMFGSVQIGHTLHPDRGGPRPLDVCPHLVEEVGEVGYFGFASAILKHGLTLGQSSCHEYVFRAGHSNPVKSDLGASQAVGAGFDVTMILLDLCAQALQSL